MFDQIGYWITHPQAIIQLVADSLLYPVLFLEVAALAWIVFEAGRFTVEAFQRRRYARQMVVDTALELAGSDALEAAGSTAHMRAWARSRSRLPSAACSASSASRWPEARARMSRLAADMEQDMTKRLERTRMLMRVGPILGLMGTLIPDQPGARGTGRRRRPAAFGQPRHRLLHHRCRVC